MESSQFPKSCLQVNPVNHSIRAPKVAKIASETMPPHLESDSYDNITEGKYVYWMRQDEDRTLRGDGMREDLLVCICVLPGHTARSFGQSGRGEGRQKAKSSVSQC